MVSKELWFDAIRKHNYETVRANVGKYKRMRDDLGFTGLMYAAWINNMELVRLLADDELNLTNGQGYTATIIAALKGSVEACQYLVARETVGLTEHGHTPLTLVAADGVTATVRVLLPYYGTMKDAEGWTPLDHAASNGHIDVVKILIEDLPPRVHMLAGAIEKASIAKNNHIVELLTLCRDSVRESSCVTCNYYRDLYLSSLSNSTTKDASVEQAAESPGRGYTKVVSVSAVSAIELDTIMAKLEWKAVKSMFRDKANAMRVVRDKAETLDRHLALTFALWSLLDQDKIGEVGRALHGTTPLMIAAALGQVKRIEALAKEQTGKKNAQGMTALMFAARRGHLDCVELLLSEVRHTDSDGYTALMHAAMANMNHVVSVLAAYEGGLHCRNGDTALHLLVKLGHSTVSPELIQTEIKLKDAMGTTALMYSILSANKGLTAALLREEAGSHDNNGLTALMAAAYKNDTDSIAYLAHHEKRMQTTSGFTALMIAACLNNHEAVEVLVGHESFCVTNSSFSALLLAIVCHSIDASRTLALVEMSILSPHRQNAVQLSANGPCSSIITDIYDGIKASP